MLIIDFYSQVFNWRSSTDDVMPKFVSPVISIDADHYSDSDSEYYTPEVIFTYSAYFCILGLSENYARARSTLNPVANFENSFIDTTKLAINTLQNHNTKNAYKYIVEFRI